MIKYIKKIISRYIFGIPLSNIKEISACEYCERKGFKYKLFLNKEGLFIYFCNYTCYDRFNKIYLLKKKLNKLEYDKFIHKLQLK